MRGGSAPVRDQGVFRGRGGLLQAWGLGLRVASFRVEGALREVGVFLDGKVGSRACSTERASFAGLCALGLACFSGLSIGPTKSSLINCQIIITLCAID